MEEGPKKRKYSRLLLLAVSGLAVAFYLYFHFSNSVFRGATLRRPEAEADTAAPSLVVSLGSLASPDPGHGTVVPQEITQETVTENERASSPSSSSTTQLYEEIVGEYSRSNRSCPHPSVFHHSWRKGMLSQVGPPLHRDCHKLRQNPEQEVDSSNLSLQLEKWRAKTPWKSFTLKYKQMSCGEIRKEFENIFYVSQVEKNFPIAFILVIYTNPGQMLRFLKSIYRPHNLYCIQPDARQGPEFKEFFDNIANCLENVFVVSNPVKVYYGHISITDSQLNCMRDLEEYPESSWKYVINLCGREVPLKTNREIVEYLQILKGYSGVNSYPLPEHVRRERFTYKFRPNAHGNNVQTLEKQAKPPSGIKFYKSNNFISASRAFVHFILHDPVSIILHDYLTTVLDPEEHFYSTLYNLPQAPGARPPNEIVEWSKVPTVDAFIWISKQTVCHGKKVHAICILSALEMQKIEKSGVCQDFIFFFNKYFLEWDPIPMDCMEERLVEANMDEYRRDCLPNSPQKKAFYSCS